MLLGTTFAHPYLRDHFRLPVEAAFKAILDLNLDYLRLGVYWSETEKHPGQFDFGEVERLLELAERANQKIVLTVGMKAPRWPEFYCPAWTSPAEVLAHPELVLRFLERAVSHFENHSSIKFWQVENEPLDKSGPNKLQIPFSFLQQEVLLVRSNSSKPIIVTCWGNRTLKDERLKQLASLGDVVGTDLYYQIPDGHGGYWGPTDSSSTIQNIIKRSPKPVWITELQTNPWKASPSLIHLDMVRANWDRAKELGVATTFFWGSEYWYALLKQGNSEVWNYIRNRVPTE